MRHRSSSLEASFSYPEFDNSATEDNNSIHMDREQEQETLKVLIATDNHLGYGEDEPLLQNDSFLAFEEVFQIAKEQKVDFVLLGGDLFHVNNPSRNTIQRAIHIFSKYCLGDDPVQFQVVSDPSTNFASKIVNFDHSDINVSLPVFSIHGNHDDPAGIGQLSALDVLSSAYLINYFGKAENLDLIEVAPVLIEKGNTKLAMYGLGSIRDERLNRIIMNGKLKWARPAENLNEWVNIFVLHQNRNQHSAAHKNFVSESMLPDFLDLVIWGHEHESLIEVQENPSKNFYVTQPGSTCRTSLCSGEAGDKNVGLLEIREGNFRLQPIKLKYQRPFIMDDIVLSNCDIELSNATEVEDFLKVHVEAMLLRAQQVELPSDAPVHLKIPFIRLRVNYGDSYASIVNPQRFGQYFMNRVANPENILITIKQKTKSKKKSSSTFDMQAVENILDEKSSGVAIQDLVSEFLSNQDPLSLFEEHEVTKVIEDFVQKRQTGKDFVNFLAARLAESQELLLRENVSKPDFKSYLAQETAKKRSQILEGKEINVPEPSVLVNGAEADEEGKMNIDSDHEDERDEEIINVAPKYKKSAASSAKKPTAKSQSSQSSRAKPSLVQQPISSFTGTKKKKLPSLASKKSSHFDEDD